MIRAIQRTTVFLAFVIGMFSAISAQSPHSVSSILQGELSLDFSRPVVWKATAERLSGSKAVITLIAVIKEGWHLYGFRMPDDGPKPTTIKFLSPEGVKVAGNLKPSRAASCKFDAMFDSEVEFWTGQEVKFTQDVTIDSKLGAVSVKCEISFMGCSDKTCLPYRQQTLDINIPENNNQK